MSAVRYEARPGPIDRNVENRPEGVHTGVGHRVDADGVVALFLRRHRRLEDSEVSEEIVVVAVAQVEPHLDGAVVEFDVRAELDQLPLSPPVSHALLVERNRNDHENLRHVNLLIRAGSVSSLAGRLLRRSIRSGRLAMDRD